MLNLKQTEEKLISKYPKMKIIGWADIPKKNLIVFIGAENDDEYKALKTNDIFRMPMDPYYSVNKKTGEVLNFLPEPYGMTFSDIKFNRR